MMIPIGLLLVGYLGDLFPFVGLLVLFACCRSWGGEALLGLRTAEKAGRPQQKRAPAPIGT